MATLKASVISPCAGDQTMPNLATDRWGGPAGDFAYAGLSLSGGAFVLTVVDLDPTSSCFPSATYEQVTPNASNPEGQYGLVVGGSPDTSAGAATVVEL